MKRQSSLKRPLIILPMIFHFATLLVTFGIILAVALRLDSGGVYTDERITRIIAPAIVRQGDGSLAVRMTPEMRAEASNLWFVAEDDAGRSISFGRVPPQYVSLVGRLGDFAYAQIRDREAPFDLAAVIRRETAPAGPVTILGHGSPTELSFMMVMASNVTILPIFLLLALTSLIVTPWIVRRSLSGVSRIAREAEQIDTDRRGRRLSEEHVPSEIAPLVSAVNDALRRLDEGYERQRRFIASAAHELRTPIAILRAKVEAAPEASTRRLGSDVQRLGTLAEQLLDLQRLDTDRTDQELDLPALVRRVVGDLAPLLIASDRTIEVQVDDVQPCRGDGAALERVVTNLVQNAIEHGGRHVTVRVIGAGFEVEDDGPGIPPEERERVFEPFHRLRPRSTGSGLGLNLVQQVVERHGGRVSIHGAFGGGTVVRVELPRP
ncbi:signal transduction histidine kinase [Novosphingobium chloroacetimidivorans]|uniref:histidine kinase n=1 Tax=Novosphingobium chloroacetimidivorans TaxID=1428314 RepID=A0A7W7NX39_9SPHN|nr:HAMP domain-containing sensor histidine kinase [Novosphingobium chloroacetimidivorans]MBB4858727.1 signal transduction histidine kinase [Novosphingobium chloroacetimidivorans]